MPDLVVYLVGGALVAGGGVGLGVALFLAKRLGRKEAEVSFEPVADDPPVTFIPPAPKAAPPPPPRANSHPERAPVMVLTTGVAMADAPLERAPCPAPRPAPSAPRRPLPSFEAPAPPPTPVPTEWARRQVGPVEPGRSKGVCSGCGSSISVSNARPLRIACPVCGRTKLLA